MIEVWSHHCSKRIGLAGHAHHACPRLAKFQLVAHSFIQSVRGESEYQSVIRLEF